MDRGKSKWIRSGERGEPLYLINEVAQMVNLSQKRIREYERQEFIKPLRDKITGSIPPWMSA